MARASIEQGMPVVVPAVGDHEKWVIEVTDKARACAISNRRRAQKLVQVANCGTGGKTFRNKECELCSGFYGIQTVGAGLKMSKVNTALIVLALVVLVPVFRSTAKFNRAVPDTLRVGNRAHLLLDLAQCRKSQLVRNNHLHGEHVVLAVECP